MNKTLDDILQRISAAEGNLRLARQALARVDRDIKEAERQRQRQRRPAAPAYNVWKECQNVEGMAMNTAERGIAVVRLESQGTVVEGKVNAFAGTGILEVDGYELHPGYGRWSVTSTRGFPDPATATEAGRVNAQKHRVQLTEVAGLEVYGPKDANAPGGQGIYQESQWAVGCSEGLEDSHAMLIGWANRQGIFRWDRDAFDAGRLEPHEWNDDFHGLDETRTFAPQGYEGGLKMQGYGQLDHAHLVRMVHPARTMATEGYAFGEVCCRALADDVIAHWVRPNTSDAKLGKSHWWSVAGIEKHTPAGIGTPHAGRQLNGALQALAAAIDGLPFDLDEPGWHRYGQALDRILAFVNLMIDQEREALYVIRYLDEAGKPSNKWSHKMQEGFGNTVPDGERPDIYKGFEHSLVLLGLQAAARCGWPTAKAGKFADLLRRRLGGRNAELEVIDHPEWSSPKQATWDNLIGGTATQAELEAAVQPSTPWWGSHPMNAYTGDL